MGLSIWHVLIIAVVVLVLFGPNRLPNFGKSLGEAIRGFKKGLNEDEIDVTNASRREQLRDGSNAQAPGSSTQNETVVPPDQRKDKA